MQNKKETHTLLVKASAYQNTILESKTFERPWFHFTPPVGWMNDPNGFSYYNGKIHLFYQYYPYETKWGPMHWGHTTTTDFVKWDYEKVALAPDEDYDSFGCFSGSALMHENKHVLIFTGTKEVGGVDGNKHLLQQQCVAYGDGELYEKAAVNPVISSELLPSDGDPYEFRDPKVSYKDGTYQMVVANRTFDEDGRVLLYTSADLVNWQYEGVLCASEGMYGSMWECPDFFELSGQQVLIVSPQYMKADGRFFDGNNTMYILGKLSESEPFLQKEVANPLDYGFDFYAPQTMQMPDGRRIMIGWMQSWDYTIFGEADGFSGMMSIPRELSIVDGRLLQKPVCEISQYYQKKVLLLDVGAIDAYQKIEAVSGRCQDVTFVFDARKVRKIAWLFAANSQYETEVVMDLKQGILSVDRSKSGIDDNAPGKRTISLQEKKVDTLRVLLDRYSIELFIGKGEQTFSFVIPTQIEADGVYIKQEGTSTIAVTRYEIVGRS